MTDLTNILGIALIGVGAASAVYGTILCYSVKVLLIAKKKYGKICKEHRNIFQATRGHGWPKADPGGLFKKMKIE